MPDQLSQICLSDGNREALIIRWRTIIILGLQDYFTNENRYIKLVVREILDMFEGLIKAFAKALIIEVRDKCFNDIFESIKNHDQVLSEKKQRLEEINNSLSANELNSMRNLIRNPEAHTLNLPLVPVESVMRCWRLFNEAVLICDKFIFTYLQNRPEFKDFLNLYNFFYKYVVNREYINLGNIKLIKKTVIGQDQKGKSREVKVEDERAVSEIIQYISEANLS